jgi:hypothetical protein
VPSRKLNFRVTGARLGEDCSGDELEVDLKACIFRTDPNIP